VRAGLKMILAADPTIEVVGEAADGRAAIQAAAELRPHVVLMDRRMPELDGIASTERLRQLPEPPQVIVLTTFHLDDYVLAALRAGARGFLLKDTAPTEIVQAVHTVAGGDAMLSPAVTRRLIARVAADAADSRRAGAAERLAVLSDREREVALEVAS